MRGTIPFEPYRYQAQFLMDKSPSRLVLKSRQVGMSQTVALEALHHAAYQDGCTVLMVSRSLEAATNLLRYVKLTMPVSQPPMRVVKDAETELVFSNQSRIKSVAASKSTGRSYAASHVYLDEFAFMPWALEIYQSVLPTVSRGGTVTVLSTPYGVNSPFYMAWSGQLGGDQTWSRHTIRWFDCPEFCPEAWAGEQHLREQAPWFRKTRPQFTAQQWASEYDCDFVTSGDAPFRPDDVAACADGWTGYRAAEPGHQYLTSVDVGRRQDATVITTLDITKDVHQVVAWERLERSPYPHIQARIEARGAAYPGEVWVESNGIGDPVIENLNIRVKPFVTTAKSKQNAITELVKSHEHRLIKHDIERVRVETLTYQWDDKDLVQDCVMSLAIGEYMARSQPRPNLRFI